MAVRSKLCPSRHHLRSRVAPRASNNPQLIVVGSLNVDLSISIDKLPEKGETVSGDNLKRVPGGKVCCFLQRDGPIC
jgi:hypothetical protein